MVKPVFLVVVAIFSLVASMPGWTHGGGLDSYGCHHNRKAGGYHCHRGSLAGQQFASKDEMLKRLGQSEQAKPRKAPEHKK